jgi:uncharacterized protein
MEILSPLVLGVVALAFLGGGLVKGVLGIGLPLVAVPVMTLVMPLPTALAVLAVPILTSNLQQLLQTGLFREVCGRFATLLIALPVGVLIGVQGLLRMPSGVRDTVLGLLLLAFVLNALRSRAPALRPQSETWLSPAIGFGAGLVGGISSFLGPPVAAYLVALRVRKELFIAATATVFLVGGLPLQLALAAYAVLGMEELLASLLAVVPVTVGVMAGERLRRRIPQEGFRRAVLGLLGVMAITFIWRGLV